ncbi:MAG: tetratricopeptide repeat protein [Cyclobacteriaceae bacterium]|nr:tetratricopeptide repeat protein [Cyclobacteriaceae bacterium]MCH8516314.1 tetratricopeptide repeat protein [Cyclobacteriaceae bacterium]
MVKNFIPSGLSTSDRILHFILGFIILCCIGTFVFYYLFKPEGVLLWHQLVELDNFNAVLRSLQLSLYEFSLFGEIQAAFISYRGSGFVVPGHYYHIYGASLVFAFASLFAVISGLNRFWFIVGMFASYLLLLGFQFQQLEITKIGLEGLYGVILLSLLVISYLMNQFAKSMNMLLRFLIFACYISIVLYFLQSWSPLERPLVHLIVSGSIPVFILLAVFALITAYDIILLFLHLLTSRNNAFSTNTLAHFNTLSLIYLFNLGLYYLQEAKIFDLGINFISPLWFFVLSAVIGVWAFKRKEELYGQFLPHLPLGSLLYLALAIMSVSTLSFMWISGNDTFIKGIEEWVLYVYLGTGLIFFLYLLANFFELLKENKRVIEVVFRPERSGWYSFRLFSLLIIGAFLYKDSFSPYHKIVSGYYNQIGDSFIHQQDRELAVQFYERAQEKNMYQHRANYSLGGLFEESNKPTAATFFYSKAFSRASSPHAHINAGNVHIKQNQFSDAHEVLHAGLKLFPNSGPLHSSMGKMHKKIDQTDSAIFYYLNAADLNDPYGTANLFGILATQQLQIDLDSLVREHASVSEKLQHINLLALYLNQEKDYPFDGSINAPEGRLSPLDFALFSNYHSYQIRKGKAEDPKKLMQISAHPQNGDYAFQLLYLAALHAYLEGDIGTTLRFLDDLQELKPTRAGFTRNVAGTLLLNEGSYQKAIEYFESAKNANYEDANINFILALLEGGRINQAKSELDRLLNNRESEFAQDMYDFLKEPIGSYKQMDDLRKFQTVHYKRDLLLGEEVNYLIKSIENDDVKAITLAKEMKRLRENGKHKSAIDIYEATVENWDKQIKSEAKAHRLLVEQLKSFFHLGQNDSIQAIHQANDYSRFFPQESAFFEAYLHEIEGDSTAAYQYYSGTINPFLEEAILQAAQFTANYSAAQNMEDYNRLLEALIFNNYSVPIKKAYIFSALNYGLDSYAESNIEELKELMDKKDFEAFLSEVEAYQIELEEKNAFF